jgi:hypothetical protein
MADTDVDAKQSVICWRSLIVGSSGRVEVRTGAVNPSEVEVKVEIKIEVKVEVDVVATGPVAASRVNYYKVIAGLLY